MAVSRLIIFNQRKAIGWLSLDQARSMLASGEIDEDAFWSEYVYTRSGRAVSDHTPKELCNRSNVKMLNRESPFQYCPFSYLREMRFDDLKKMRSAEGQRLISIALLAAHVSWAYYSDAPSRSKHTKTPGSRDFIELAQLAFDRSPGDFSLVQSGLQLSIHAELQNVDRVELAALSLVEELKINRPDYFQYTEEKPHIFISRSDDISDLEADYDFDRAWSKHIGV